MARRPRQRSVRLEQATVPVDSIAGDQKHPGATSSCDCRAGSCCAGLLSERRRRAAHKCNNFKGSIYMVFDYMDHDLTGLMERKAYKFKPEHVRGPAPHAC